MALSTRSSVSVRSAAARPARRQLVVRASSAEQSKVLGVAAGCLMTLAAFAPMPAKADLTSDLLAKSAENKAVNDKKRLLTSSANLARSRTVADGTCAFPTNLFGCDETSAALTGGVKFISDDASIECEGKEPGKCASQVQARSFGK